MLASSSLSKKPLSNLVDKAMDKALPSARAGAVMPGVSLRNGPVEEIDTPMPDITNGVVKRKARESTVRPSYAEAETSDDDMPLVREGCHTRDYEADKFPEQKTKDNYQNWRCSDGLRFR
jgi:hypothetical protein